MARPAVEPEVDVTILHPEATADAGILTRAVAAARLEVAEEHARGFRAVGATRARVLAGQPDGRRFGARLREIVGELGEGGLIVLGSGAIPLATARDRRDLVAAARASEPRALTNNRYSGDVVAVSRARSTLRNSPDLPSDNALPRWLAESAGFEVRELRQRWRLAVDLDSPLDLLLVGRGLPATIEVEPVVDRLQRLRDVAADPRAELVVAGRTSSTTLRWLERSTASRTRALVEERGLRAIGLRVARAGASVRRQRPPRSVLGLVLDERGPEALGAVLAELGDAALVDTRVLLAHRLGADENGWPAAEDRFASDLLLPDGIRDPWLRALTASARDSAIPVLLGGHTLVGPGIRLALRPPR